jgi:hypothetical protein
MVKSSGFNSSMLAGDTCNHAEQETQIKLTNPLNG